MVIGFNLSLGFRLFEKVTPSFDITTSEPHKPPTQHNTQEDSLNTFKVDKYQEIIESPILGGPPGVVQLVWRTTLERTTFFASCWDFCQTLTTQHIATLYVHTISINSICLQCFTYISHHLAFIPIITLPLSLSATEMNIALYRRHVFHVGAGRRSIYRSSNPINGQMPIGIPQWFMHETSKPMYLKPTFNKCPVF